MKYRRGMALALVLALVMAFIPVGIGRNARAETLGTVTSSSVHVRKQAFRNADIWFDLPQGHVCTITEELDNDSVHWYKVVTTNPEIGGANTYIGFIHGDFFRAMTADEIAAYNAAQAAAIVTPAPTVYSVDSDAGSGTIGVVTNGGTNFREGPSIHDHSLMKLERGTEVEILTIPSVISNETFYQVRYQGTTGYIMSTFIRVVSSPNTPTPTPENTGSPAQPTPTPPDGPTGQPSQPTPTPPGPPEPTSTGGSTPTPTSNNSTGYTHVRLILSSCHLRESPNGSFDSSNDWEGVGSVLPLAGNPVQAGGYTWYPVTKGGRKYYVRNDCVQPFIEGIITPTPTGTTPTPTPTNNIVGYIITTKGGCNLRSTPGGTVIKTVGKNRTLPYLAKPIIKDGYEWYLVEVDGNRGYLRDDVVRVVNTITPTPMPTPTSTTGQGYVKTVASGVNFRQGAGYTEVLGKIDKDVVMPYYSTTTASGVVWYYVYHATLGYGYIHGKYLVITDYNGDPEPTPTPYITGAPTATSTNSNSGKQEASYTTLRLGSTGNAVKNLVTELKNQGYYKGSITNKYTSSVERAVRSFQEAKGLTVDGIAGAATQHALYGTVPIGAGDNSNLEMVLYPAEKIDWYTGGINELWARGDNYKVYDVKTGIVWWAHRWAGGSHVDAEPLTAADTARLCKSYGVTTAQEIADKNLYQRRPLLVTIGTRTFACSLYGVPHNYPEGDTISNNDFKGQVCIHFSNSKTHNSNNVDSGHEEAIEYAWEHCPAGHK